MDNYNLRGGGSVIININKMSKGTGKGFTLIELLVVIAILAVLATAVLIVINPGQLIRQGRDSTRISDLAALNSAVSLYLADVATPSLGSACAPTETCTSGTTGRSTGGTCATNTTTTVAGAGWITVDFTSISSGSPLARLPLDPNNGSTNCGSGAQACFYSFICKNSTLEYEISAAMESTKFAAGGGSDVEGNTKDGGDNANAYEVGNNLAL